MSNPVVESLRLVVADTYALIVANAHLPLECPWTSILFATPSI